MKKKEQLYWVKLALNGNIYDTVKIQTNSLDNIPKKSKVLSYKPVKKQK